MILKKLTMYTVISAATVAAIFAAAFPARAAVANAVAEAATLVQTENRSDIRTTEIRARDDANAQTVFPATAAAGTAGLADAFAEKLTPELVELYETQVAGKKILSDVNAVKLEKMAKSLDVSVQKLKALILLRDLASRTGRKTTLKELASLNDMELVYTAKKYVDDYAATLPPEERERLKAEIKAAM